LRPSGARLLAIYKIGDAAFLNVLAAIWAWRTSQTPEKPKPWQVVANHVGTIPDIASGATDLTWLPPQSKPLPIRLLVAAIDAVGMGALTAGAMADYLDSGPVTLQL
jgi:hypothetical protein